MLAPGRRPRPRRQFRAREGQHLTKSVDRDWLPKRTSPVVPISGTLPKTGLPSVTLSRLDYRETGSRSSIGSRALTLMFFLTDAAVADFPVTLKISPTYPGDLADVSRIHPRIGHYTSRELQLSDIDGGLASRWKLIQVDRHRPIRSYANAHHLFNVAELAYRE